MSMATGPMKTLLWNWKIQPKPQDSGITAAVAAVAEHSIARQIAAGRPDPQDQAQLTDFAEKIREKLSSGSTAEPAIPGNRPYKKAGGAGMVPKPTRDCVKCGHMRREMSGSGY